MSTHSLIEEKSMKNFKKIKNNFNKKLNKKIKIKKYNLVTMKDVSDEELQTFLMD